MEEREHGREELQAGEAARADLRDLRWKKPAAVFGAAFFSCLLWGSAAPCIKIGYALFSIGEDDAASRLVFAGARFVIAGLMVILSGSFLAGRPLIPRRRSFRLIFVLMMFQTVLQYYFYYSGLARGSGVHAAVITALGTFFSILLSVFCFHFERLSWRKICGSILGFAGVMLVVLNGSPLKGTFSLHGDGWFFCSTFMGSMAACCIKRFSREEDPVTLSGWQFLLGGVVLLVMGLAPGGSLAPVHQAAWLLLLYMGFISAGAYTVWGILLKYNDVSLITILGFMNPVLGVVLSGLTLGEGGEAFRMRTLVSLLLVLAGIAVAEKNKNS